MFESMVDTNQGETMTAHAPLPLFRIVALTRGGVTHVTEHEFLIDVLRRFSDTYVHDDDDFMGAYLIDVPTGNWQLLDRATAATLTNQANNNAPIEHTLAGIDQDGYAAALNDEV